jgi:hypothetical protein
MFSSIIFSKNHKQSHKHKNSKNSKSKSPCLKVLTTRNSRNREMSHKRKMKEQNQRDNPHHRLEMVQYQTTRTEKGAVRTIETETKRLFTQKKSKP